MGLPISGLKLKGLFKVFDGQQAFTTTCIGQATIVEEGLIFSLIKLFSLVIVSDSQVKSIEFIPGIAPQLKIQWLAFVLLDGCIHQAHYLIKISGPEGQLGLLGGFIAQKNIEKPGQQKKHYQPGERKNSIHKYSNLY